jgi:hypothetical protein
MTTLDEERQADKQLTAIAEEALNAADNFPGTCVAVQSPTRGRPLGKRKKSSRKGGVPGGQRTLFFSGSDWIVHEKRRTAG